MNALEEIGTIHPRERVIIALTYLAAIVPLFGLLIAGIILLVWQQRSDTVVFHAKQAIAGQAAALLCFIVIILFSLFALLVGVLSAGVRDYMLLFDRVIFFGLLVVYVLWHFAFAWMALEGRDLNYPLIGGRLRD